MVLDMEFRNGLKKLLEEDNNDIEIIRYVLNHTMEEWPRAITIWAMKLINTYDKF